MPYTHCVLCGRVFKRVGEGRHRLYCGPGCKQKAYRIRQYWKKHNPLPSKPFMERRKAHND